MKLYAILISATLALVLPAFAEDDMLSAAAQAQADGELVKGKSSFKETWVNPKADFTSYNKILLGDAQFEFRDVGPGQKYRSNMRSTGTKSEFGILEEDREKFESVVGEAFTKELSRSKKFDIVTEAGPGTILLEGAVLDIVSHVPPEITGMSETYLATVATATLVLELLDSQTGEVLAYVEERRKIGRPGGQIDQFSRPANSVTVWAEITRWARGAASRLRSSMEKAQKGR
jgi:hypothetical protein